MFGTVRSLPMKILRCLVLLVLLAGATRALASPDPTPPTSPRLEVLRSQLEGKDDAGDIAAFWAEVGKAGTPLIEPAAGDPAQMLVTFLWRGPADRDRIDLGVFGVFNHAPWTRGDLFVRVPDSDVWYRTYKMSSEMRAPYMLIGADGAANGARRQRTWPSIDAQGHERDFDLFVDPLNPRTLEDVYFGGPTHESYFEGPKAPRETYLSATPQPLQGRLVELKVKSDILGNERKVVVYVPAPRFTRGRPPALLVMFDGLSYITPGRTPEMLDRMIAAGAIVPTVAVMVDFISQDLRQKELAPNDRFPRFIAEELAPMIRAEFGVSKNPRLAVIAGASRGGLAASYIAFEHPEIFGNVIGQSSALWWGPTPQDIGTDWLARQYEGRKRLAVRFYLETGTLEADDDMRRPSRRLRDVLAAKGNQVTYREFVGGHNFYSWRASLPQALTTLLPGPNARGHADRRTHRHD